MREIKFRAWDKMANKMVEIGQITWSDSISNFISLRYFTNEDYDILARNQVELMQYTGLKDKNGKEIYEGDILHGDNMYGSLFGNPLVCIGEYVDTDLRNITLDEDETFPLYGVYIKTIRGIAGIANDCTSEYFEVLGNIYENPELIKKAQA